MIGGQQSEYEELHQRGQAANGTKAEESGWITEEEVKRPSDESGYAPVRTQKVVHHSPIG